jgi:cytochrome c2
MFRYLLFASALITLTIVVIIMNHNKKDYSREESTLAEGKKLFINHCISCHGLEEEGIGPRLGGITLLLSERDLTDFIRDPAKAITSGNERARTLLTRYKQTMPSFGWMDDNDIQSILSYIHYQTEKYKIGTLAINVNDKPEAGLSGRLVRPVERSALKIELEDFIQIPRLSYSTPDLGIVTMRSHPSGDGRLFVSDQGGVIYEIDKNNAEIFIDLRSHIPDFSIGPGIATGLGSFDFHPDFLNNGLLYITHAEKFKGQRADYKVTDSTLSEVQWVLSEWKVEDVGDKTFKGTQRELLRLHAPTFGHGAQDIGFIPQLGKEHPDYGLLYWGFGDGGSNNIQRPELGHHLRSFLGTILRIDPRGNNSPNGKYGIPADNPFVTDTHPITMKEIWAYGFRNPHRISWDRIHSNRMMVTDIGESNIEEINIVEKGGDYGWPIREGNFGIATKRNLRTVYRLHSSDLDLYKKPYVQYDHEDGFAISGGYVYEGDIAILKNKYVFGDIVNGKLFYVNIDGPLSDSSVYEIAIVQDGKETNLREMSHATRLHLRIGYDRFTRDLFVITKVDGKIRRVSKAY